MLLTWTKQTTSVPADSLPWPLLHNSKRFLLHLKHHQKGELVPARALFGAMLQQAVEAGALLGCCPPRQLEPAAVHAGDGPHRQRSASIESTGVTE